jgi:hypothetical protein
VTCEGEDVLFANFVCSHPLPIRSMSLGRAGSHILFMQHAKKDAEKHDKNWWERSGFAKEKAAGSTRKKRKKAEKT